METLRNTDVPLVSSLLTLKRFHSIATFSYFIVESAEVTLATFTSRDQSTDRQGKIIEEFHPAESGYIHVIAVIYTCYVAK